ncbi:unnamed protein product [Lampetra fluviatilis]
MLETATHWDAMRDEQQLRADRGLAIRGDSNTAGFRSRVAHGLSKSSSFACPDPGPPSRGLLQSRQNPAARVSQLLPLLHSCRVRDIAQRQRGDLLRRSDVLGLLSPKVVAASGARNPRAAVEDASQRVAPLAGSSSTTPSLSLSPVGNCHADTRWKVSVRYPVRRYATKNKPALH